MAKKSLIEEVRGFMQLCIDAEGANRAAAQEDIRFSSLGEQWPTQIRMQRDLDRRPCLTINKTDTFVRSVVNNMRQQRPRIKVHPVSGGAQKAVADVIQGLTRHIEVSSNADAAYDTGADYQVRMGWGYWRVDSQYVDEMSWEQDLCINRIRNPFSVYYDPSSVEPDGLDATRAAVTYIMRRDDFKKKYPGKNVTSWNLTGPGDDIPTKDEILLAEYQRIEEKAEDLIRLSDGSSVWASDFDKEKTEAKGLIEIDRRKSVKRQLKQSLLSGDAELESRELPGKYIRIIPVFGGEVIDSGKVTRYGMVRHLKDPQRMYNFWRTQETEFVALAPKAPWLMAEGQDEGHEDEWNQANTKNYSSLKYKPTTITTAQGEVPLPPPQRQEPQAIPAASVNAAQMASEDLKAVAGMFDPALGAPGQETSGVMVQRRQQQSDLSNFHFYDNYTRSIRATGVVILDLIPHYYDTQRVIRIIGEDGMPDSVTINEQAVGKVLNDVTVGRYDVVMDTGPGYDTKRLEAQEILTELAKAFPQLMQVGGDLILRQIDAPGVDALADRLAALIPAAQIDKELPKDMDPQVRKFVASLMQQLQSTKQVVQQLTMEKQAKVFGIQEKEHAVTEREMLKEDEETKRLHIKEQYANEREERRINADESMNSQDNQVSMVETFATLETNRELGRMKAQQHGVPNNNRPTNQK